MKILASRYFDRKKNIYVYTYVYKKLYKCQRLVLFEESRERIFSLSLSLVPFREATKLREVNSFKEEIHSRPYDKIRLDATNLSRCNDRS